jgi:hypothetical protein
LDRGLRGRALGAQGAGFRKEARPACYCEKGMANQTEMIANTDAARAGAGASSVPDINAETFPFEFVQKLLDEAAYINAFSLPSSHSSSIELTSPQRSGAVVGFKVQEVLHRFQVEMKSVSPETGIVSENRIGEPLAHFEHRWLFMPPNFVATPGQAPPPTRFDPTRSQRYVMLDSTCVFEGGKDGFRGFGTGLTYPGKGAEKGGVLTAAVGSVIEGFGRFKNRDCTYTYCGSIKAEQGFSGQLLLRVVDPGGELSTENTLPPLECGPSLEADITYIMFRGQKHNKLDETLYSFGPDGQVNGLNVTQELRVLHLDAACRGGRLRTTRSLGPIMGKMTAKIAFNLFNPGAPGTVAAPIPFQSFNRYAFSDSEGNTFGTCDGDGHEGRTFLLALSGAPGQMALRFGGFGPVLNGTGRLAGIEGLMTDNSVVGIAPHALATLYTLRVNDPHACFRPSHRIE